MLANAATMRILIKGGKVVNDDCTLEADVYIENGIIQQVGRELMIPGGAKVIDATGKLVIPGGIDTSTHFHQTFMNATCVDDFYHGTKVPPGRGPPGPPGHAACTPSPRRVGLLPGVSVEHPQARGVLGRREHWVARQPLHQPPGSLAPSAGCPRVPIHRVPLP